MTKPKQVATSLKDTITNPVVLAIQNKTTPMDDVIKEVSSYWNFDLFSRKPSPAYTEDGVFQGTDLDLAVFLFSLHKRNAVINIPEYSSMRGSKVTEGTSLVSKNNRHGQLLGVQANKDTFIFSIKIKDMNVYTSESVGDFRTFALTDFDGSWYEGWKKLQFIPDAKENEFVFKSKILTDSTISFKHFIHPNRWVSFYGQYYFITKLLIDRLTNEAAHMFKEIKRMNSEGLILDKVEYPATSAVSETKAVKVKAFESIIDFPEDGSSFKEYESSLENLELLTELRRKYVYTTIPSLRFMTRATEMAFYNNINSKGLNTFPSWIKNVKWEEGYKPKGARTQWNRIVLYQPGVGRQGVGIRFREYDKTERVNENYKG